MTVHSPVPHFTAARLAMVENQLRPQGVTDSRVLNAMSEVERERFLPADARPLAYVDRAIALGGERFLPAPAVLGQLLTQMMPEPGQSALVVGAGSGYSAAVLSRIGLKVTALEDSIELSSLDRGLAGEVVQGPLEAGYQAGAPYDQILIDGAIEVIPDAIVAQLAEGGRLGAALIERSVTRLIVGRKAGGAFGYRSIGDAGVPRLPGFIRPKAFEF